ncbi:hypothetical protein FOXYS1_15680 [Fusarium oxysporum]|uniref:PiggyBac transposable element-derived protein domain-containing protein n=1 Tax=Fusarium oxysporum TaxID=5507 RepID=A0A8H4YWC0_FUSOX|nr:hypothetical protein FOXYS1_15680 [Fusarium oxysporum]
MDSQQLISQAVNAYDDNSFIRVDDSRREQPADNTCRPIHDPILDRGYNFEAMVVPTRPFEITALPSEPLLLFQQFVPISLVESWVCYTNSWVSHRLEQHEDGTQRLHPQSRLLAWKPTSTAEIYVWLATLIYMRIHKEPNIEDYWKVSKPKDIRPVHPVVKWISYNRFQLLSRHLHIYDPLTLNIDDMSFYGRTFSRVHAWSDHIQHISTVFYIPGTSIAVDECMVRFLGRSLETTTIPSKPIPTGFKVWTVAQRGYFLRWIWHRPGRKFGPVGVRPTYRRLPSQLRMMRQRRQLRERNTIHLNPTQAVVIALVNLLPKSTYHVFLDNLFSSCDLFRRLRQRGHGATGTARKNCGIYKPLVKLKAIDNTAAGSLEFNVVKAIPTADNKVNQIAWKDNALVLFLTTVFKGNERLDCIRKKPTTDQMQTRPIQRFFGDDPVKQVSIPSIAAIYNNEMNAVDRGDQMRAYWGLDRRVRRGGWKALAWDFLLGIALVNSFILQQRGQPQWKAEISQGSWRQRLVNDLMEAILAFAKENLNASPATASG